MLSFHNDTNIKNKYLARVKAHIEADNLIRGIGWEDGKGCAVGCTLEKYHHKQYEIELGIPEWLARVEDCLFEGMSEEKSRTWPYEFLKATPLGVNLELVKAPFLIFVLESALEKFDHEKYPRCKTAICYVIELYTNATATIEDFVDTAFAAAFAADAAADDDAADDAAADDAARAAARAAAWAAWAAFAAADAADAVDADAADAARAAAFAADAAADDDVVVEYDKFADKLLELLQKMQQV